MSNPYIERTPLLWEGSPFSRQQKDHSEEIRQLIERIDYLIEKTESLEKLIKHVFDGHVLIDGQFVRIKFLI
jgi:hypothetical protein